MCDRERARLSPCVAQRHGITVALFNARILTTSFTHTVSVWGCQRHCVCVVLQGEITQGGKQLGIVVFQAIMVVLMCSCHVKLAVEGHVGGRC